MQARFTVGAPRDQAESQMPDDLNAPVIGETDADHEPAEPERPDSTAPHSELDLSTLIHWRDAFTNGDANKWKFRQAVEHISWEKLELLKAISVDATNVMKKWACHGLSHSEAPVLASDFEKTFLGFELKIEHGYDDTSESSMK